MSEQMVTIDAETFPLTVRGGTELMLMQPVARDAVAGLDEACTEASLDFTDRLAPPLVRGGRETVRAA